MCCYVSAVLTVSGGGCGTWKGKIVEQGPEDTLLFRDNEMSVNKDYSKLSQEAASSANKTPQTHLHTIVTLSQTHLHSIVTLPPLLCYLQLHFPGSESCFQPQLLVSSVPKSPLVPCALRSWIVTRTRPLYSWPPKGHLPS